MNHAGLEAMKLHQQVRQVEPDAILLCRVLNVEHAAGYRDVTIRCMARDGERSFQLDLIFAALDAIHLSRYISQVDAIAWEDEKRPVDAQPDELSPILRQSATVVSR